MFLQKITRNQPHSPVLTHLLHFEKIEVRAPSDAVASTSSRRKAFVRCGFWGFKGVVGQKQQLGSFLGDGKALMTLVFLKVYKAFQIRYQDFDSTNRNPLRRPQLEKFIFPKLPLVVVTCVGASCFWVGWVDLPGEHMGQCAWLGNIRGDFKAVKTRMIIYDYLRDKKRTESSTCSSEYNTET